MRQEDQEPSPGSSPTGVPQSSANNFIESLQQETQEGSTLTQVSIPGAPLRFRSLAAIGMTVTDHHVCSQWVGPPRSWLGCSRRETMPEDPWALVLSGRRECCVAHPASTPICCSETGKARKGCGTCPWQPESEKAGVGVYAWPCSIPVPGDKGHPTDQDTPLLPWNRSQRHSPSHSTEANVLFRIHFIFLIK